MDVLGVFENSNTVGPLFGFVSRPQVLEVQGSDGSKGVVRQGDQEGSEKTRRGRTSTLLQRYLLFETSNLDRVGLGVGETPHTPEGVVDSGDPFMTDRTLSVVNDGLQDRV